MELTSLDLSILEDEFKELEEGHIQKVYQRGQELTLEVYVHGEGKKRLIIGTNHTFVSKYKRDNPMKPPGFCMELRKHLSRLDRIEQKGFDRILEIESGEHTLICEIFGKGNFILLKDDKIIGALREEEWADREIRVGNEYKYPEPAEDPRDQENFVKNLAEGEIVRKIAAGLSLGGTYAEEICARSEIDKNTKISELSEEETDRVDEEIRKIFESVEEPEPVLYKDGGRMERATPFPLETYEEYDSEKFEKFSEALDEFFYRKEQRKEEREKREAYRERKEGLERQLEQQKRKKEGLKKSAEQNREKAELVYENYQLLEEIQEAVSKGVENHGWKETEEMLQESERELTDRINSLNEQDEFISVSVDGMSIKLTLDDDLEAIASRYYDKAKSSESKIDSVEIALEETREDLEELEEEDIELDEVMEDKTEKREKEWFEKYRWLRSSEDFLVLCGRDAQTNDMLVNKHMESNDLYFHADFDGAPSVVVKDGQECGEATREEAAKAAVTFAKTWKAGIGADDVYYVDPEQVTEEPESGEYLQKGAFVIRGDREYMRNMSVEASIGVYEIEGHKVPMCGPENAIREHCDNYINLRPGHTKKSDLAKTIQSRLSKELELDYIIRALPPGKSEIKD
jgi:predicted ribosome quality control (RQC) complex YloA/Tae2 family protein